jgi:hypothetical protein
MYETFRNRPVSFYVPVPVINLNSVPGARPDEPSSSSRQHYPLVVVQ